MPVWALKSRQAEMGGCPSLGWTLRLSDVTVHGPEVSEVAADPNEGKLALAELLIASDVCSFKVVKHATEFAIVH